MPLSIFNKLGIADVKINNNSLSVLTYNNNPIKTVGTVVLKCIVKDIVCYIRFVIVDVMPILGLNACMKLNLLQKVDHLTLNMSTKSEFINNFAEVFSGTGKVPFYYKIILKKDVIPFVSPCRRIPDTVKPAVKKTLDDLCNRDIITKIEEPTE